MNPINHPSSFSSKLSKALDSLQTTPEKAPALYSLTGSARSLFCSLLAEQLQIPLVILVDSYETAERTIQDLNFFAGENDVHFFPHWDTIPYDSQSPDKNVLGTRFSTLSRILSQSAKVVVTTPNALMQQIMPPSVFDHFSLKLETNQEYDREALIKNLVTLGFVRVDMVEEMGEFSVRGELMDIFPVTEAEPVRLDFFDNQLESIKKFDIESQRSSSELKSLFITPAHEVLLTDEGRSLALERLKAVKPNTVPQVYNSIEEQIESGQLFPGIENLLPLFYNASATLLDYFPKPPRILFFEREEIEQRVEDYFDEVKQEYEYSRQEGNPTLDPDVLFLPPFLFLQKLNDLQTLDIQSMNLKNGSSRFEMSTVDNTFLRSLSVSPESPELTSTQNILIQLKNWSLEQAKIAIATDSQSKAEKIKQMAEELDLSIAIRDQSTQEERKSFLLESFSETSHSFCIFTAPVSSGFRWVDETGHTKIALISDEELFGPRKKQSRIQKSSLKHFFSSLGDLKLGDYIVHVEYGIGRYEGLKKIKAGASESDFLVIVYHGGDKVYVPVDKFHLVQKYVGGDVGHPPLDKLGSKTWAKTKEKIKSEIDDMAQELIKINAIRKTQQGVAFSPDSTLMNEFALAFMYQETEDQEKAIRDVTTDMESERPMDRLVCGDVGFGKTEVAMRAAYKAVIDGYQVGILVPTTILAQQHFDSFRKRFENTPVEIGLLSRFQTNNQIKTTLKMLKESKVDIAIGTHRLLSNDVEFSKLGLLVIDEEQRFGVKHKEKIRQFRTTVDTLTLSATPIPRTLHMSLVGIRDISVINTPPIDRRAIRTRLLRFNDYVIQEAVNREVRRKGQVFFIHNRVESIYQVGQYLAQIMPRVKIAIGHGQMSEKELEQVMVDFINKEYDVLLSTTIVEAGLDIPNVNTIIINNADQFGLSQLYQLRGRVGRSNVQAYAYLLTPREKILTETARKRLSILQELNHLGSGFKIANYDLELRGAGNVLGSQQSGHIAAIGFELYTAMVEEAVFNLQVGEQTKVESEAKTNDPVLHLTTLANLPDDYINSMNQRLDAYKSISGCKNDDELWEIRSSLEDRYGRLPTEAVALFQGIQIKLLAKKMHILQLSQLYDSIEMFFSADFQPDQTKLLNFLRSSKWAPKLLPENKLRVRLNPTTLEEIYRFLQYFRKEMLGK